MGGFSGSAGSAGLLSTPPPAPVNPGASAGFGDLIAGVNGGQGSLGPASLNTLRTTSEGGNTNPFSSTGNPTDVTALFNSMLQQNKTQAGQARANVMEQFGASGTGQSTPAALGLSNFEAQNTNNLSQMFQQLLYSSSEAAKGRQMQSVEGDLNRQQQASVVGSGLYSEFANALYPTVTPYTIGGQAGWGNSAISGGTSITASTILGMLLR